MGKCIRRLDGIPLVWDEHAATSDIVGLGTSYILLFILICIFIEDPRVIPMHCY